MFLELGERVANKLLLLLLADAFFSCLGLDINTWVILSEHSEYVPKIRLFQVNAGPAASLSHLVKPVLVYKFQLWELLLC